LAVGFMAALCTAVEGSTVAAAASTVAAVDTAAGDTGKPWRIRSF
jgi:hypothetical protein